MSLKQELIAKIQNKTLRMGVCGLGYVGLPLAVDKAKHGFKTIGFDVQTEKVDMFNAGKNYIGDVVNADWVKSNCIIILPAIDYQRKALKRKIDDAKIINDEEALSKARAEYRNLQPFLNLLKPFRTFIS